MHWTVLQLVTGWIWQGEERATQQLYAADGPAFLVGFSTRRAFQPLYGRFPITIHTAALLEARSFGAERVELV